jgi:N-acetyl-anhydromuramyl-L-alanine amidase AmpD
MTDQPIILPKLIQKNSPNQSSRRGVRPTLIVWHESAGNYQGGIAWLCNPAADASAHLFVREDGLEATQLVHIAAKAWHAVQFNAKSIGVEHANITPKGFSTEKQLQVSARIFGWLCLEYQIPPRWSRNGQTPGVCRHLDLGAAGGNHLQCGPGLKDWQRFLVMLGNEIERGGYRDKWAL